MNPRKAMRGVKRNICPLIMDQVGEGIHWNLMMAGGVKAVGSIEVGP